MADQRERNDESDENPNNGGPVRDAGRRAERTAVDGNTVDLDIRSVVERYHSSVYKYAYRLAGNAADAEDLAQQTFLIAQQKLGQVREADKVDRWLFAVLRSCFLKLRRRQQPASVGNLADEFEAVDDRALGQQAMDREVLDRALANLSDEFRMVLVMFYFDEYSYKQIAQSLEVPIGTVMSRLARAKRRLRHEVQLLT